MRMRKLRRTDFGVGILSEDVAALAARQPRVFRPAQRGPSSPEVHYSLLGVSLLLGKDYIGRYVCDLLGSPFRLPLMQRSLDTAVSREVSWDKLSLSINTEAHSSQ